MAVNAAPIAADPLPRPHARRLREIYRSAGWPARDAIEIDLLAAGLLERQSDTAGRETLRVTDAGLALLARSLQRNRGAFDAHEALVGRVVREMQRAGRVAWRGLGLRAKVEAGWVMARPDVYSLRHTTIEAYCLPLVHEVKVRRADLLADLKRPDKRAAYLHMAAACCYVLAEGIAEPEEVPPECGVIVARRTRSGDTALDCLRPAPLRAFVPPFSAWMALARATPAAGGDGEEQAALRDADTPPHDALPCVGIAEPPPAHDAAQAPAGASPGPL